MIFLLLFCVVIVLLVFSWITMLINRQAFNVPGPLPLPLIGNGHIFVVKSTEYFNVLKKLSNSYGDAYLVYFFSKPYVILSHPKHVEALVSSTELIIKSNSYDYLRPWLGDGLLTARGQKWKTHRKFLTPAFHFNILQSFLPIFCKNGRILSDKLDQMIDGQVVDLLPMVALAALDNVTEAIMGLSVDSQTNIGSEYVKSIEIISKIVSQRMQIPHLGIDFIFKLTADKKKQDTAIQFLHNHTRNVIATRRNDLKKMNVNSAEETNDLGIKSRHAFLDSLLLAEEDGRGIDEESIREEVDTFMFAGHDTTASGICYALHCISKYPDVQTKILQEQESIFGDEMDRDPTFTELSKMKYLELVIKETLRIFPSVPIIERKIFRDIEKVSAVNPRRILQRDSYHYKKEVGELKLKKGTSVVVNIFQMQRDPQWFTDPLEFRPERFDPSSPESKNAFSFLAFSAGPRNCIGQKFAMVEMKATLSLLVRRFRVIPVDHELELCADLILKSKNGIKTKFLRRSSK